MKTTVTAKELATILGASVEGNPEEAISSLGAIETAARGQISFCASAQYQKYLVTTGASCVIVALDTDVQRKDLTVIRVADPFSAFTALQRHFASLAPPPIAPGISPAAIIHPSVRLGNNIAVGPCAVIAERVSIGENAQVYPNVSIGNDVTIGAGTVIYPNVTIYNGCKIGARNIIHAGTVIGADGFGFVAKGEGYEKVFQTGIVVVEDDVEIGANVTIDRATLGETRIGRGTKIDNLVQIAHNVVIGENAIICAQTGIAGSTKIGAHVTLAGQAGIVDHIEIANNVIVTAQSGVSKSIATPGAYRGSPAQPLRQTLKNEAVNRRLPELIDSLFNELKNISNRLETIERAVEQLERAPAKKSTVD